MKRNSVGMLILLLGALPAFGEEGGVPAAGLAPPVSPAQAWLELQRSGQAASPQRQSLSGPAMDKVHERYLRSFEHPVPMVYKHEQVPLK